MTGRFQRRWNELRARVLWWRWNPYPKVRRWWRRVWRGPNYDFYIPSYDPRYHDFMWAEHWAAMWEGHHNLDGNDSSGA